MKEKKENGIVRMMARSEKDVVTFSTHDLQFSVGLVKAAGIDKAKFARVGVQSERKRIYLGFLPEDSEPGLSKVYGQTAKSSRKMIAIGTLYRNFPWLAKLKNQKDKSKRQFKMQPVEPQEAEIFKEYQYFISVDSKE